VPLHAALEHAALRTGPFTLEDPTAPAEPARPARPTARRRGRGRGLGQSVLLIALAAAALMLLLTSTDALGATLVTPKCNDINLRTGPATTYARKTQVDTGARLTMVAKVDVVALRRDERGAEGVGRGQQEHQRRRSERDQQDALAEAAAPAPASASCGYEGRPRRASGVSRGRRLIERERAGPQGSVFERSVKRHEGSVASGHRPDHGPKVPVALSRAAARSERTISWCAAPARR